MREQIKASLLIAYGLGLQGKVCDSEELVSQTANRISEEIEKVGLLSDEDTKEELLKYASEVCESNPIRYWNNTEMINRIAQAQLDKILSLLKE